MNIKASDAIVKCLELEGIEVIFGYPGGAVLPLYEALRTSSIEHVLVRQEQSAAHMAGGYGQALGKVGVCVATSGPGATNLITGIATAYMDSIPLVAITGQVNSNMIGKDTFQEADITGASEPFTKHNYLVSKASDIPRIIKEAFYIAGTGRKGPVLIDIPRDIQEQYIDFEYPEQINIRGYKPTTIGNSRQIKRAVELINKSQRPVICIGGGIKSSGARKELLEFVHKTKIPVVTSLMGVDGMPNDSEYFIGILGSHGYPFVNECLNTADLLIVVGARFADRTTSMINKNNFTQNVIHIDIDPAEIGKNIDVKIPIVGDAKVVLTELNKFDYELDTKHWLGIFQSKRKAYMKNAFAKSDELNPKRLLMAVNERLDHDSILVSDVGLNQIWAAHSFMAIKNRRFLTSGGLGTMGYSLPAAIGAKKAKPDTKVIATMGDGGFQMLMSELAVAKSQRLGIKVIIFNNENLGMVRELQRNNYNDKSYFGVSLNGNPDFMKIAEAYGFKSVRISKEDEIPDALDQMFNDNEPFILECIVSPDIPSAPHLGGKHNE